MGLVFLRDTYSRFLGVKDAIEAGLPTWGGKTRPLTKEDFSQKSAILLQHKAQFDTLVALTDSADRAIESIESDYENLRGVLPKSEYQELDKLLFLLNPEELKRVSGDVFGCIYEYFLTQFFDQKATGGGEFFAQLSLVSLIANVIEPVDCIVLDLACSSGGIFVQSARVVERRHESPTEQLTFYGLENNVITIRLAKMNLAMQGLEDDTQKSTTYYEDPHELLSKADFVIPSTLFNVDEIDVDKGKSAPLLPFGLPGVNKKGKFSNGNYVWISYFCNYLNEQGQLGVRHVISGLPALGATKLSCARNWWRPATWTSWSPSVPTSSTSALSSTKSGSFNCAKPDTHGNRRPRNIPQGFQFASVCLCS